MAKKGGASGGDAGGMSKKAAGQARKADAAAAKAASKDQEAAAQEAKKWDQGSKSNAKAEAAAAKAAEAARKKAEKDALLREEEAALPSKPKGTGAKKAEKKTSKGIDSALSSFGAPSALNATGIDNALDALDITGGNKDKVDRHPERRFKAAYAQYEERRLEEMKDEKGLRRQQRIDMIRKEFEKHPDNPFNQVAAAYNTSKEELASIAEAERVKKEKRLANPTA